MALLLVVVFATGRLTVAGRSFTRADEFVILLAVVVALRALAAPLRLPEISPARLAIVGAVAYALAMGFIVVTRHLALRTHALDLGYYVQVVWSMAAGHGAYVTFPPMHAWGDHFSPVFYLLVPLTWVAPGAIGLLVVQTLVLAAGGLAVYGYAARRLGAGPAAGALAVLFLVNPSLHGINVRDIHPQAFVITLIVVAALAFDTRRYAWCAVALALTLACREDAAIAVVGFGIWLAAARGRWKLGAAVALASVLVLFIDLKYVMPLFRGEPYPHLHRHAYLGSSIGEILVNIVVRPWRWVGVALTGGKILYLLLMLLPLGFLPLLAPRVLMAAVPTLALNLLSVDPVLANFRSQYQAFVLPFLMLAAVEGFARIRGWRRAPAVLALAFFASVLLTARTANDLMVTRWRLDAAQHAAHALMREIPGDVPVSVNERLAPHLATRRQVFIYPTGIGISEYVLDVEPVLRAKPAAGYREIGRDGGFVLLQRDGGR
ncbi:MAG: DUF2079 domain-containing protein [Candidatus Rokuibacteriota bacterium]